MPQLLTDTEEQQLNKYPDNNRLPKLNLLKTDSEYYDSLLLNILEQNEVFDFEPEIILEVMKNTKDNGELKENCYEKISAI